MTKILKDLQNFGFTVTLIRTLLSNLLAFNFDLALAGTAESACYSAFSRTALSLRLKSIYFQREFWPKKVQN